MIFWMVAGGDGKFHVFYNAGFNFRSFLKLHSLSFNKFHEILNDSVYFSTLFGEDDWWGCEVTSLVPLEPVAIRKRRSSEVQ